MRNFEDILRDVARSCNNVLFNGYKNNYADVIEAATKIYIAELKSESQKDK
jgi:hypothetical protein